MEELFNGQLSFADIEAEKFLQIRRTHADRRVNAMDRLTDDVINELIQLCLPLYHPKISGFGAVDDVGKRPISLWHKQTPGILGVDFYPDRLYNIL